MQKTLNPAGQKLQEAASWLYVEMETARRLLQMDSQSKGGEVLRQNDHYRNCMSRDEGRDKLTDALRRGLVLLLIYSDGAKQPAPDRTNFLKGSATR